MFCCFTNAIKQQQKLNTMSIERTMQTKNERTKMDAICEKIMVTPIDGDKLASKVAEAVIEQRPDLKDKKFEMADKYALSADRNWVLDNECCANRGPKLALAIRRSSEVISKEDGKTTTQIFPFAVWDFEATAEELADYLLEPVDLKTFMGQRYCYNPRIKSNMTGLIKELTK